MREVVLDTNVIISGLGWGGVPGRIIDLWKRGKITICISSEILEEYLELLERAIKPKEDYRWFIRLIEQSRNIRIVKPKKRHSIIREDPDDDMFLDCAVEGKIKYIITGDKHLLKLKSFKGVKIVSPDDYLKDEKRID